MMKIPRLYVLVLTAAVGLMPAIGLAQTENLGCPIADKGRLKSLSSVDRQALYDLYEHLQGDKAVKLFEYVRRPDLLEGTLFAHDALKKCDLPVSIIKTIPFTPMQTKSGVAKSAGKILYALLTRPGNHQAECVVAARAIYASCLSAEMPNP
jgi:hypothetical protein